MTRPKSTQATKRGRLCSLTTRELEIVRQFKDEGRPIYQVASIMHHGSNKCYEACTNIVEQALRKALRTPRRAKP